MSVYVSETKWRTAETPRFAMIDEGYALNYDPETKEMEVSFDGLRIVKKPIRDITVIPISDRRMARLKAMWERTCLESKAR